MSKQDYELLLPEIEQIERDDVMYPNLPVDVFLQEAENLFHWVSDDKDEIVATGLNWELVEQLPVRAGACREAQSLWNNEYQARQDAEKLWKEQSPLAYDLRDRLVHSFLYAFRDEPDLRARVAEISEGGGHADMIQDLNDLATLGKNNQDALQAINFDMSELDKAAEMSDNMADLLAQANGDKFKENEKKIIRDKAYTHLKELVDEVRECGKYVFWRNPDRLRGYASAYHRRN
jgi:hypothetical protein